MPTPLAHGVAAWATARTAEPRALRGPRLFALVAFLAIAPDLDFLPGMLVNRPSAFHRGPTHSLAGAFIVSLALSWLLARLSARRGAGGHGTGWWFAIIMPTYCAHLVLDLVMPDTRGAAGMRLFWPVSDHLFAAPIPLPHALRAFLDLQVGMQNGSFVHALLSGRGISVILVEGLLFTPLLLAPKLIAGVRRRIAAAAVDPGGREQPET